jgi:hypothetical protein
MDTVATQHQKSVDNEAIAGQQAHWASTFDANPDMYGTDPSAPGLVAARHSRPRVTASCSSSAPARDVTLCIWPGRV